MKGHGPVSPSPASHPWDHYEGNQTRLPHDPTKTTAKPQRFSECLGHVRFHRVTKPQKTWAQLQRNA